MVPINLRSVTGAYSRPGLSELVLRIRNRIVVFSASAPTDQCGLSNIIYLEETKSEQD